MFLLRNLEEILASIAISITVLVVIVNVVLRYGFGFVVPWSEGVHATIMKELETIRAAQ